MHISRRTTALGAVGLVVATLPLLPLSPAQAAGKPDLVVTGLTVSAPSVVAGKAVKIGDTTKNAGAAKAGASVTRYYLSTDKKWSKADPVLGSRTVGRLAPGKHDAGAVSAKVPAATKARSYWVLACADATKKVAESKETNNCRASGAQLKVKAPATKPGVFPQTPNPLPAVTPTDDSGYATVVHGTYHPFSGLDLYAYSSDSTTTYHLHLPGDFATDNPGAALQGDEDVTMTVLSGATGLPAGTSLLAGVRLEPEGLQLANPGTLTITGPALTTGNLADQTGVVWNAQGTDLSMSPILPPSQGGSTDPGTAVLSISHFSTPGVVDASAAGRTYLLDHPPARVLEQLQAKAADLIRPERLSEMAGHAADPSVMQNVVSLYNDYFDHQVVPELNAALTDDTLATTALNDAFRWERYIMLNGGDPGSRGDLITTMLPKIVKNAIDKAWARCATDHHLSDIMTLLGIARFAEVLGDPSQGTDAWSKALDCGHFQAKVSLDTTYSYHYPAHVVGTFSRDIDGHWATKQATLDIGLFDNSVTAPLQYDAGSLSYSNVWKEYTGSDCSPIVEQTDMVSTADGTVSAFLYVDLNPYEVVPGQQQPARQPGKLVLTFAGAHENYHWYYTACGSGSGDGDESRLLATENQAYTQGSNTDTSNTIKVPIDPSAQVGATLYNDIYSKTWDNHQFLHEIDTASTTISVVHKPLPQP